MTWDVIVVGGGVLGTFHALFAAEKGLKTLLIERNDFPRDASVRNFGMVIAGAMEPGVWRDRAIATAAIYRDLSRRVPFALRHLGIQYVAGTHTEARVIEEFAALAPGLGYRCLLQDPLQARAVNPMLNPEYCKAALLFPDDFTLDSRALFRVLIPWMAEHLHCTYMPNTVVVETERHGDRCRVRTAAGEVLEAGMVILCTGGDLRTLYPNLFTAHKITNCKLQMMRTVPQPGVNMGAAAAFGLSLRRYGAFAVAPSYRDLLHEPMDLFLAEKGIHVLMAQNAAGEIIIGDSHQYIAAEDPVDEQLDMAIDEAILHYARQAVHLPSWKVASRWWGTYAVHPEDQFLDLTIEARIHVVTGIGGKGMTCGPGLARELIDRFVS